MQFTIALGEAKLDSPAESNMKNRCRDFLLEAAKQDSSGEQCFKDLALFALSLLAMPLSNADVERVFSQMNNVKSKLRNRMGQKTLSSILCIRYGLRRLGICCKDFIPSQDMLQRFSVGMYRDGEETGEKMEGAGEERDDFFL
ncbi:hypothetical protein QQF64_018291 [Cirrhinus molitorella]|uniref:HAT C-terminal dimerisation domain-containing protein n=1 Tax=Cirrhinus molitorella TaxID=172907 RepID=A0ABR3LDN7_9TELE